MLTPVKLSNLNGGEKRMTKQEPLEAIVTVGIMEVLAQQAVHLATKNMSKEVATAIKIGVAILIPIGIALMLKE